MDENQEKLKGLLREALPLLQEFIETGIPEMEEEEGAFGRSDQEVDMLMQDEGYAEDVELDEAEQMEAADEKLDYSPEEDDKEMRKRMSAKMISKKLGRDKKAK